MGENVYSKIRMAKMQIKPNKLLSNLKLILENWKYHKMCKYKQKNILHKSNIK